MHFSSSGWTIALWLFPRNSSQMLAPDNAAVVPAGEEEFPFFPAVMDFLSQSSSLWALRHLIYLFRQRCERERLSEGKGQTQNPLVRLKIQSAHKARSFLILPCSPAWAPLTPPCPDPPKALSSLWRCPAALQTKPRESRAHSFLQTGWVFCQTGISKMV